ncbi:MAG TPA: FAD-dependent oxidoreductase, partial [Solirubrobacteraceae bacterium]|nr:FAD-dependent oxidoreductase [Solirubrobacteraceae bacterium]
MGKPHDGRRSSSSDAETYRYESEYSDRELGMHTGISRRDFLDGFALTVGAAAVGGSLFGAGSAHARGRPAHHDGGGYPPNATGLTGSDPDALKTLEALVQGRVDTKHARDTGEYYDLVVVGAGISGLSAAYFYLRDVDADARILILDPHEDFGGHARRNEFVLRDDTAPGAHQTKITNAGSQSMDHIASQTDGWSQWGFAAAKQMLDELGVDYEALADQAQTPNPYTQAGASGSRVMW